MKNSMQARSLLAGALFDIEVATQWFSSLLVVVGYIDATDLEYPALIMDFLIS